MRLAAFAMLLAAPAAGWFEIPADPRPSIADAVAAADAVVVADWVRLSDIDGGACDPAGVVDAVRVVRQSPLVPADFFDRLQPLECDAPSGLHVFMLTIGWDDTLKCLRSDSVDADPAIVQIVDREAESLLARRGRIVLTVRFPRPANGHGNLWDAPTGFTKLVAQPGFGYESQWPATGANLPVYFDFTTLDRASSGKIFSEFGNIRLAGEWRSGAFVADAIEPEPPEGWPASVERPDYAEMIAPTYVCKESRLEIRPSYRTSFVPYSADELRLIGGRSLPTEFRTD